MMDWVHSNSLGQKTFCRQGVESDAFSILKEMLVHCYSATVSVRPDGLLLGKYISLE